jgi:hypothetical protein
MFVTALAGRYYTWIGSLHTGKRWVPILSFGTGGSLGPIQTLGLFLQPVIDFWIGEELAEVELARRLCREREVMEATKGSNCTRKRYKRRHMRER